MELKQIKHIVHLRSFVLSFTIFTTRLALFLSVLVNIYLGNNPTAYYVFVVTAFYNILRVGITMSLPMAIGQFVELNISINRIKKILTLEEMTSKKDSCDTKKIEHNLTTPQIRINIKNAIIGGDYLLQEKQLNGVDLKIHDKQLVVIVGQVGSGKSTLLQAILKEISIITGNISVAGNISYAAQEPWLFTGTIKQNILFGNSMDIQRYKEVLKVCALETDLSMLPNSDQTIVGERGTTLSGGQKARLNLARAVYKEADIYLLDDPLSAVDAHVGKQLYDECICSLLKNKTVVLVTHQLQYIKNADRLVLVENGKVTIEEASTRIEEIGQKLVNNDNKSKENVDTLDLLEDSKKEKSVNLNKNNVTASKEHRSIGTVSKAVYKNYVTAGGGFFTAVVILIWFIIAQSMAIAGDYFITLW